MTQTIYLEDLGDYLNKNNLDAKSVINTPFLKQNLNDIYAKSMADASTAPVTNNNGYLPAQQRVINTQGVTIDPATLKQNTSVASRDIDGRHDKFHTRGELVDASYLPRGVVPKMPVLPPHNVLQGQPERFPFRHYDDLEVQADDARVLHVYHEGNRNDDRSPGQFSIMPIRKPDRRFILNQYDAGPDYDRPTNRIVYKTIETGGPDRTRLDNLRMYNERPDNMQVVVSKIRDIDNTGISGFGWEDWNRGGDFSGGVPNVNILHQDYVRKRRNNVQNLVGEIDVTRASAEMRSASSRDFGYVVTVSGGDDDGTKEQDVDRGRVPVNSQLANAGMVLTMRSTVEKNFNAVPRTMVDVHHPKKVNSQFIYNNDVVLDAQLAYNFRRMDQNLLLQNSANGEYVKHKSRTRLHEPQIFLQKHSLHGNGEEVLGVQTSKFTANHVKRNVSDQQLKPFEYSNEYQKSNYVQPLIKPGLIETFRTKVPVKTSYVDREMTSIQTRNFQNLKF